MSQPPPRKVIIFGADGADLRVIEPLVAAGELPHFARMMREGAYARMETVVPPNSGPAWVSMATGKNPGKHGVYHFTRLGKRAGERFLMSAASVHSRCLWHLCSEHGLRVGVINVPLTYPPAEVNGFFISGLDAPRASGACSHPPGLMAEIRREVGDYRNEADLTDLWAIERPKDRRRFLDAVTRTAVIRKDATLYLMKTRPCDLLFVVFTAPDRVQHRCWKFYDAGHPHHDPKEAAEFGRAVPDVYRLMDRFLGEVMAAAPSDTTVLLVSDHGSGPAGSRFVDLNRWLAREGHLRFRRRAGGRRGLVARTAVAGFLAVRQMLRRFTSPTMRRWVRRAFARWHEKFTADSMLAGVDWSATRLYSDRCVEAVSTLWVNQVGREPFGIVPPGAESERLLAEVEQRLRDLVDPDTGERPVEAVLRRADLYNGDYAGLGPDLIVRWKGDALRTQQCRSAEQESDRFIGDVSREESSLTWSGEHGRYGIFFAQGPGVLRAGRIDDVSIFDVTPTTLTLLGVPIPGDVDGRPVAAALEPSVREAVRWSTQKSDRDDGTPGLTREEEQTLAERLKSLGYLE